MGKGLHAVDRFFLITSEVWFAGINSIAHGVKLMSVFIWFVPCLDPALMCVNSAALALGLGGTGMWKVEEIA